jgi:hypothetical protein
MPNNADERRAAASAKDLAQRYGVLSPEDIDLPTLCWGEGLYVEEGPIVGADAWMIDSGKFGIARIREDIPYVGQKRFAIAHELGHWSLHRGKSQAYFEGPEQLTDYKRSPMEVEANAFAAEILMPEPLFMAGLSGARVGIDEIRDRANVFSVGPTAAIRRFVDLTQTDCLLVAHENGRSCWYKPSRSCSLPRVRPGVAVPPDTEGASYDRTFVRSVAVGEWHASPERQGCLLEQTIRIPDGPNLTLLSPFEF